MGMTDLSALPLPSDLPGRPGEQLALHKALKGLLGDVKALREEVTTLKADIQRERHYRQTGTLPQRDHFPIDFEGVRR